MAVRAEGVNQAMLSILKKMDAMVSATKLAEDNSLILLGSIETVVKNDVSLELKKHTTLLSDLKSIFGISAELMNRMEQHSVIQNSLLSSIEIKVAKLSKSDSVGGGGAANDGGLAGAIGSIPEALMKLVKVLAVSYLFGDFLVEGAGYLNQAMIKLLSVSEEVDMGTAANSLLIYGLISSSKLKEFVDFLGSTLTIKNMIFGSMYEDFAIVISNTTRILLNAGKGIDLTQAAVSIAAYNLIVASKLGEFVEFFNKNMTIKNFILSRFWSRLAQNISDATNILLKAGNRINLKTAAVSITAYAMLSASNIGKLIKVLSESFLSKLFGGGSMVGRAEDLSKAVNILLKTGSRLIPETIIKSVFAINVLSASNIGKLIKALTPGFLSGLFSKPNVLTRRAEDLSGAVRAMLLTSKGIDNETAIKSVLSFTLLAYGVDILISALRRAAIWNPFIILGVKITNIAIKTLIGGISEVVKDSENILAAAVFVVALSFSIGTLLTMCVIAGLLAPFVLVGAMVLGFMVKRITAVNQGIKDAGVTEGDVQTVMVIATILGVLVTAAATIMAFNTQNDLTTVALNIVLFTGAIFILSQITLMLAKKVGESKTDLTNMDLLSAAVTGLIQAVSLVVISKAMQNPPQSLKSVLLFGLMTYILAKTTAMVIEAMGGANMKGSTLIAMSLFMLGLVLITQLVIHFAQSVGAAGVLQVIAFGIMIGLIAWIAKQVGEMLNKSLGNIAKAVIGLTLFALGALIIGSVVMLFAASVTPMAVLFTGLAMGLLAFIAYQLGKNWKTIAMGALALSLMSLSILFFTYSLAMFQSINLQVTDLLLLGGAFAVTGMAMYLYGQYWKEIGLGAMVLAFTSLAILILAYALTKFKESGVGVGDAILLGAIVAGLGIAMKLAGDNFVEIGLGAGVMILAGIALVVIAAGVLVFKKAGVTTEDALILGAIVVGLGLAMAAAGAGAIFIALGSASMILAGVSLLVISGALAVFKTIGVTKDDAIALGLSISSLAGSMALAGLGSPLILLGSAAMLVASVALLPITGALAVFKTAGMTIPDADALGASVKSLAGSMALAGLGSPLILLGSLAMTAASVALLPITGALAIFKNAGFNKEDGDNLEYGLSSIINGFLGGRFPGGVLEGLKFAGQAAARAALLTITVPAMVGAGIALIAISKGLTIFKTSGFTPEDGVALESTIGSIAKAFTIVTDKERQKKLGINIDPIDLMTGILSLSMAGNVLSSLAEGVKAWANLEVNEYEVIGAGTSKAKLVIKSRRKLGESDFTNAANGMAKVITAIAEPFALVGRLDKGQPSGNPLYDMVFGGGFVSAGVASLKNSGDTIVSLAAGVKQFATMQFVEFEVVNAGTSKAKLVPKGVTKIGEKEIESAGKSIATVIGVVAKAFSDIGKDEAASEGVFAGGFIARGVKALAGVGENLKNIVDSVLMMAKREIPTFDLIDGGTSKAKLVPGKPKILSDKDLTNAATTIMDILKVIATGFYDIGKKEDDSSSFWGDGYIAKGIKAISGVGDVVAKVTDSVIKIATGTITPMTAVGTGTNTKLVPGTPVAITDAMLKKAGTTINSVMMIIGKGIYNVGIFYKQHAETIDGAIGSIPKMVKSMSSLAESVTTFSKLDSIDKAIETIPKLVTFGTGIYKIGEYFENNKFLINGALSTLPNMIKILLDMSKSIIKFSDLSIFEKANNNLKGFSLFGTEVYNVGAFYNKNQDVINGALNNLPSMIKIMSSLSTGINTFSKLESTDKATLNFQNFTSSIFKVFDPALNKGLPKKLEYMDKFTSNIVTMASPKNSLDKVAVNFDKIQKSMQLFKGHVNGMDLEKLTTTDSMMKSLAIMSKSPEVIGEKIAESIEKAFEDLLNGLKKLSEDSGSSAGATGGTETASTPSAATPAGKAMKEKPIVHASSKPGASISARDIETAMVAALSQVTVKTKVSMF